ncbi:hypothetical protein D3C80_909050 [compost metagenome]
MSEGQLLGAFRHQPQAVGQVYVLLGGGGDLGDAEGSGNWSSQPGDGRGQLVGLALQRAHLGRTGRRLIAHVADASLGLAHRGVNPITCRLQGIKVLGHRARIALGASGVDRNRQARLLVHTNSGHKKARTWRASV